MLAITTEQCERPILKTPMKPWQANAYKHGQFMWTSLCAMVALACLAMWAITGHDDPTGVDIVGMIALTTFQIFIAFAGLRWWKLRELRPLVGTFTRTDLRIEPVQINAAAMNAMSVKQLVVAGVSSVFAASAALISGALQLALHHQTGLIWIAISLVFAFVGWRHFKLVVERSERA